MLHKYNFLKQVGEKFFFVYIYALELEDLTIGDPFSLQTTTELE